MKDDVCPIHLRHTRRMSEPQTAHRRFASPPESQRFGRNVAGPLATVEPAEQGTARACTFCDDDARRRRSRIILPRISLILPADLKTSSLAVVSFAWLPRDAFARTHPRRSGAAPARWNRSRHGARNHAMILIAYRHGLRASEVVGLRWSDVHLSGGPVDGPRARSAGS